MQWLDKGDSPAVLSAECAQDHCSGFLSTAIWSLACSWKVELQGVKSSEEKFEPTRHLSPFLYHPPVANYLPWDKPRFLFYCISLTVTLTTFTLTTAKNVGLPLFDLD